jgi:hypothetical protein
MLWRWPPRYSVTSVKLRARHEAAYPRPVMTDTSIGAETVIVAVLFAAGVLALVVHRLQRTRPSYRVGLPLAVGFGIRLMAIAGVSSTGLQSALRGGDESTFLTFARLLPARQVPVACRSVRCADQVRRLQRGCDARHTGGYRAARSDPHSGRRA